MSGTTMWDLQDRRYLRRDGENSMSGPLILRGGDPESENEAVRKAYVDTLTGRLPTNAQVAAAIAILTNPGGTIDAHITAALLAYLQLAGGVMTGPLTLAGAPVNALHAATMAYADLMLPLTGGVLTGALTLSGAPVNALHAATMGYADLMLPLTGGVMTGVLSLAADPLNAMEAATKDYVDALPVGLSTYDAVVAAAGGNYTSVVTACATEAVGARIFVKSGTYNETASVVMQDGQMLEGENPENTIIDFGAANRKITSAAGNTNVVVRGLTIQGSIADYTVEILGLYARVTNNRIIGTGASFDGVIVSGLYSVLENNYITGFSRVGAFCATVYGNCSNNSFVSSACGVRAYTQCRITGNIFHLITEQHALLRGYNLCLGNYFNADAALTILYDHITIVGNYFTTGTGIRWGANHDHITITGNTFISAGIRCTHTGSTDCAVTGNTFKAGDGIWLEGTLRFAISGNTFNGAAKITLNAGTTYACITGNNLEGSTARPGIADPGIANMAKNNFGMSAIGEKAFLSMQNMSGGDLVAGDVVVLNAAADGDQVTTTVNQGDDMVFGMVADTTVVNTAFGYIQTEGQTVKLKVNGTVAIGIGDLLGTLDAVKIAMKAAAGDMAFAIALEAYAGADSLGVIDALLIKPRKV